MQEVIAGWLTDNLKFIKIADHSTATTGDVTSDEVDARGFERAVFLTSYSACADLNFITVWQGATASGEAESVAHLHTGASNSYEDLVLEIKINPAYPFLKLVADRSTSSTIESIWCILAGARTKSQVSTVTTTLGVATFDQPAMA